MTQRSKGEGSLGGSLGGSLNEDREGVAPLDVDPAEDARMFAALRSLGDPRAGDEMDDATMLARVLAGVSAERAGSKDRIAASAGGDAPGLAAKEIAPAPVISFGAESGLAPKRKRPALRRGVAMLFAGLAVVATVAYAAQRILSVSAPPPAPPEPALSSSAPVLHEAPKPRPAPAPSETATMSETATAEPTASASAEPAPAPTVAERAQSLSMGTQASPNPGAPSAPSADELLTRAQSLYTAGDTAGATAAYRNLIARYPGSGEARAALISLGQLALRGGRAGEALGHFDRYLAGGGPLAIEARVGRIAALRSLGRTADERAAIEDFLSRHGDGVHAIRLRARLAEIAGP